MGVLDVVSLAILAILLVGVLFLILIVAAIPGVLAKNAIVLGSSLHGTSRRVSGWIRSCKNSPVHKTETTELIGHRSRQGKKGHTVTFDGYIPGVPGAISPNQ